VVVFELFARFMDIVFESFMLQGISQISMLLRAGFRLLPIIWLIVISGDNHIELEQWILIDISASIIGCIWGIINLWKYLKEISQTQPGNNNPIEYIRYSSFSFPIYIAGTIMLLSSQDTIKLIAANILNSVDFASFGFAATLVYMLNRYLPMTLLVGMLRPLLVDAREKPDYQVRLPKIAGLLFKLNMFTLMPIIAFFFVFSEEISLLLTGGRYPDAANYMLAFIPILILQTLRFITSLTALAMEGARVTLVATVLSLTGLFSGVMLSHYIDGYGLCVGLAISNLIFSVWIIKKLRKTGLVIDYQVASYVKLLITSIMAMGSMIIIETILQMNSPLLLVVGVLEISIFYLIVTYIFKPFQEYERDILNKILKRKVFVW
jgi:O-antigen/teichoic acid export membrane protein